MILLSVGFTWYQVAQSLLNGSEFRRSQMLSVCVDETAKVVSDAMRTENRSTKKGCVLGG